MFIHLSTIVGSIAIISEALAVIVACASMYHIYPYSGIIVLVLSYVYTKLRDKYRKLRENEIDEEYKKWRYDNTK